MSDTNIFKVEQSRLNMDLVDEEWEKDYLSDDGMLNSIMCRLKYFDFSYLCCRDGDFA